MTDLIPRLFSLWVIQLACCSVCWGEIPRQDVVTDTVEVLERNHFYDCEGRLVFQQLIAWTWNDDLARYDVVMWRMINSPSRIPRKVGSGYEVTFFDGELLRTVRAPSLRETWTQRGVAGDPELNERDVLPKEMRRELTRRVP